MCRPADALPPDRHAPAPSLRCPALGQLCNTTVPPTALSPSSLAPDVLHLEACSTPGCVGLADPLATNPASPQLYPVLGAWKDSKKGQPDITIGLQTRAVSFDKSEWEHRFGRVLWPP